MPSSFGPPEDFGVFAVHSVFIHVSQLSPVVSKSRIEETNSEVYYVKMLNQSLTGNICSESLITSSGFPIKHRTTDNDGNSFHARVNDDVND